MHLLRTVISMKEAPRKFLPLKAGPEPGDRLVAVPCYVLSANMAERGLLTRLTVKEVTAVVDAARGSAVIVDGAVEPREMPEIPEDIKILPARLKPSEAEGAALAAVSAASPRGWKRGLRHSELFFKHSGEDVSALRLYIIRGPLLIDAFTGESSGAASLIEFII